MTLATLKKLDDQTAMGVLTRIALGTSANPGVGDAARYADSLGPQEQAVLSEIRGQVKVAPDDTPARIDAQIAEIVSQAISESVLRGKNAAEIRRRAGAEGRLPPSMYEIKLSPGFAENFRQFGARDSHALDTVAHPDDYQHLLTEDAPADAIDEFSLFQKWQAGNSREHGYWALVTTHRVGATLQVLHLWRVYPSDVNIQEAKKPLDVLAAFCETYGLDIQFGQKTAKFFAQERWPKSQGPTTAIQWTVLQSYIQHITTISMRQLANKNFVHVGLVYAIGIASYKAAIKKHGAMVR
jgi:hypothetical protein